jgi:hypothetical protein
VFDRFDDVVLQFWLRDLCLSLPSPTPTLLGPVKSTLSSLDGVLQSADPALLSPAALYST